MEIYHSEYCDGNQSRGRTQSESETAEMEERDVDDEHDIKRKYVSSLSKLPYDRILFVCLFFCSHCVEIVWLRLFSSKS